MKVSTKGQYALRVMLDFAEHVGDGYIRLREVADRQGISKTYLEQIMVLLNKADFFKTVRGYQGGYQLAHAASKYTIGDILRITEGTIAPIEQEQDYSSASDRHVGVMARDVWDGLEQVMVTYLDGLTLQDVLDAHSENAGWDFVI
jgi:Rrf2 family protein